MNTPSEKRSTLLRRATDAHFLQWIPGGKWARLILLVSIATILSWQAAGAMLHFVHIVKLLLFPIQLSLLGTAILLGVIQLMLICVLGVCVGRLR